jgi:hypothetical protein
VGSRADFLQVTAGGRHTKSPKAVRRTVNRRALLRSVNGQSRALRNCVNRGIRFIALCIVLVIARRRSGQERGNLVTYLRLIGDESEVEHLRGELEDRLESEVHTTADDLLNGRRFPPLQIRIRGLNLGEAKDHVESEIRHIVVEELVENALAQRRGAWLAPQDTPPPDDGPAISVSLGGLSLPQSLGGLDLPPADAGRIEAQVQQKSSQ